MSTGQRQPVDPRIEVLFRPLELRSLRLANRIVMAPMTRNRSPGGVPGADVAAYYRRRAEGGVGLIITEGTYIPHPGAGFSPDVPRFHGEDALAGWQRVVEQVHAAGGRIFPQLWHVGIAPPADRELGPGAVGPSGLVRPGEQLREPMTQQDIDAVIHAYGEAAASAQRLGFDGVEIHAAHGYLIDQFFWEGTNRRTDAYGGDLVRRTRFAVEVVREIRRKVGREFPICLRYSQWKLKDYAARLARTPQELATLLEPLVDAGVDLFHCSQRRFWEPEFDGSTLNLAGWTARLTGRIAIAVGSVTLNEEFMATFANPAQAASTGIDELLDRMQREEFQLIAIGRSLIVNPDWPRIVGRGSIDTLRPFDRSALQALA
jgi:2,4-dienoyl-CoA reductase-like NADH-dependent reductase (Old Yellow Enzyme family)